MKYYLFRFKSGVLRLTTNSNGAYWNVGELDSKAFPGVTFDNSPVEVEIKIKGGE